MSKTCLYLDDCRIVDEQIPGYEPWIIVRNYTEFVKYIEKNGCPDLLSFDHDLHETHTNDYYNQVATIGWQSPKYELYQEKTGLECAKYLCERHQNNSDTKFPAIITVHSMNPVGAFNILSYINGYIKHAKLDSVCYEQRFKFKI